MTIGIKCLKIHLNRSESSLFSYVTSASLELGNNLNMCQNFRALNEILFSFIFRQDINLHVQIFGQSGNYYEILCSLKAELYYFHKAANVHKEIDKNS